MSTDAETPDPVEALTLRQVLDQLGDLVEKVEELGGRFEALQASVVQLAATLAAQEDA